LENFQLGLRDDIQTIVRSRNYKTLSGYIRRHCKGKIKLKIKKLEDLPRE